MTDNDRTAQLERACSYLRRIPAWYLATTDVADGYQPRVRPFSFAMVDDGKLWFCTSRDKDVWAELSANPKFELSGWKPGECPPARQRWCSSARQGSSRCGAATGWPSRLRR